MARYGHFYGDWHDHARSAKPYLIGLLAVAVSALFRFALDPVLLLKDPFLVFAAGVVIAALYGGLRAGLTATILGVPVCDYLFIAPRYTFFTKDTRGDSIMLVLFTLLGVGMSMIIERLKSALALEQSERNLKSIAASVPGILFTATSGGVYDYFSQRFSDYSGVEGDTLLAGAWFERVHPDDREGLQIAWLRSVQAGHDYESTFRLRRADGAYRWFKCHATPLRDSRGEIVKWFGVCADIDHQKKLEDTLEQRTRELSESNEDLKRFAHVASHDLQEPLRTIGAFSQLLFEKNRDKFDEDSARLVRYIRDGVERMGRLIQDLLDYAAASQVETNHATRVDLNSALKLAIANLDSAISEAGAKIEAGPLPSVGGNESSMVRLFQNLIGNAIKYRRAETPEIRISASHQSGEWIISIQDNGVGFDMQNAARIFEAFQRLSPDPKVRGTGIGLTTVKRIIERHGGRVWAESEPAKGSTFYFSLPDSAADGESSDGPNVASDERSQNPAPTLPVPWL